MTKLEQIDKNLKCGEEDCQELKKELRHNKSENLDNCFSWRADKLETTDRERERHI